MNKKLNKIWNLINKIKNDITIPILSDFLDWFYNKLNIHFNKQRPDLKLNKWNIYFVDLWQNIWSELNKSRPCIIYSNSFFNTWNTVTIIPIKSYNWKKFRRNINIFIKVSNKNCLDEDSMVDISWIKQVDKKRLWMYIGNLESKYILKIDKKLLRYFGIKKQTVE